MSSRQRLCRQQTGTRGCGNCCRRNVPSYLMWKQASNVRVRRRAIDCLCGELLWRLRYVVCFRRGSVVVYIGSESVCSGRKCDARLAACGCLPCRGGAQDRRRRTEAIYAFNSICARRETSDIFCGEKRHTYGLRIRYARREQEVRRGRHRPAASAPGPSGGAVTVRCEGDARVAQS